MIEQGDEGIIHYVTGLVHDEKGTIEIVLSTVG